MSELYPGITGSPITHLVEDISAAQTTIAVGDDTALPDGPNICTIGYGEELETIKYGVKSNGVLQEVVRGIEGTPRAWPAGTEVARFFTAYDHNSIIENFNSHLADTVTESLTLIRDLALTGQQTIALATNKMPKRINISASMHGTPRLSIGSWTNGTGQCQFEFDIGKWSGTTSAIVRLTDTDPNINRVNGIISSVQNGSFVINWTKDGAGITGNAFLIIDVLYHE